MTRRATSAADFVPDHPTLPRLRAASKDCRGCDLYKLGTQTVFGEGPRNAAVMMVGEQPGDAEDKAGHPFVGPAGRVLDRALEEAGIDRDDVYVTNAVKHFKWAREKKSTRRLHKTPSVSEVRACFPWLEHEIALVRPRIVVALGATAAKALFGRTFSVTKNRGIPKRSERAPVVIATVHPSSILRAPSDQRRRAEQAFVSDMRVVARQLAKGAQSPSQRDRGRRKLPVWLSERDITTGGETRGPSNTSGERTPHSRK